MLPPAVTQKLKQIQLFENIGGTGYKSRKLELLEQRQNISYLPLFISRQEAKVLQYHCCIRTQTHTASLSSLLPCNPAAEETQCEWLGAGGMIALAQRVAFTWGLKCKLYLANTIFLQEWSFLCNAGWQSRGGSWMKEQKTKQEWWCCPLPDSLETSLYNPVFISDLCRSKRILKILGGQGGGGIKLQQ